MRKKVEERKLYQIKFNLFYKGIIKSRRREIRKSLYGTLKTKQTETKQTYLLTLYGTCDHMIYIYKNKKTNLNSLLFKKKYEWNTIYIYTQETSKI